MKSHSDRPSVGEQAEKYCNENGHMFAIKARIDMTVNAKEVKC